MFLVMVGVYASLVGVYALGYSRQVWVTEEWYDRELVCPSHTFSDFLNLLGFSA